MNFVILPTTKNQSCIIFHRFRYYLKTKIKDGSQYWNCNEKVNDGKCKATITTLHDKVVKINGRKENDRDIDMLADFVMESHSGDHSLSVGQIESLRAIHSMKEAAASSTVSIEKIYRTEETHLVSKLGDLSQVAKSLFRKDKMGFDFILSHFILQYKNGRIK